MWWELLIASWASFGCRAQKVWAVHVIDLFNPLPGYEAPWREGIITAGKAFKKINNDLSWLITTLHVTEVITETCNCLPTLRCLYYMVSCVYFPYLSRSNVICCAEGVSKLKGHIRSTWTHVNSYNNVGCPWHSNEMCYVSTFSKMNYLQNIW